MMAGWPGVFKAAMGIDRLFFKRDRLFWKPFLSREAWGLVFSLLLPDP